MKLAKKIGFCVGGGVIGYILSTFILYIPVSTIWRLWYIEMNWPEPNSLIMGFFLWPFTILGIVIGWRKAS